VHHGVDGRLDVVVLGLGEEADVAQVDTQDRSAADVGELGGSQDRAVATDDEDQLAAQGRVALAGAELDPLLGVDTEVGRLRGG